MFLQMSSLVMIGEVHTSIFCMGYSQIHLLGSCTVCKVASEEMNNEMRFREDLGFSSLDFMSFLGELEDTFDLELDESEVLKITTLGEALNLLEELQ